MFLYLISQDFNNDYDTYDSAVVCADTEDEARMIHPDEKDGTRRIVSLDGCDDWDGEDEENSSWCAAKDVQVQIIGIASNNLKRGVICASFNAG